MTGITVALHQKRQTGTDAFNSPVYIDTIVPVDNVLVGQPTTEEITSNISLYGKRADYVLGIPKGDTHQWEDTDIVFFGHTFRSFGAVIEGIEANVPTPWHRKVMVARYE